MTAVPHAVPTGWITWPTVSQQMPAVQHPGLSLSAHRPTLVLHVPILHGTPLLLQSASLWQQPGCAVPLHSPVDVQMSLKVHALLSLHSVPGVPDQLVGLLPGTQIWHGLAAFVALLPMHWPSIRHQPGSNSGLHWPSTGSHDAA